MNFNRIRYNNNNTRCSCGVEKFDKSVQTDDLIQHDNNTSYSSSLSSDDTRSPSNNKQRKLPRSICKNRTPVIIDDDDDDVDGNTIEHEEIENKPPVVVKQTNNKSRTVFIPAGYNLRLTQTNYKKNSNNGKTCNNHQTTTINHEINEIKPVVDGCNCPNFCKDWYNCTNWKRYNLNFDNIDNVQETKKPLLKESGTFTYLTDINKVIDDNLLIHGRHIPKPSDSNVIDENIRSVLNNRNIDEITRYSWTIIARHLSLFLIGPRQVGKYLNHLPSICTFCLESTFYNDLSEYSGPIIIIVTPYQETSKQIYEEIQYLLKESLNLPEIQVVTDRTKDIKHCDLLIIDSWKLLEFLQKSKLSLKRCCHLILENLDILLYSQGELLVNFLKILNQISLKRPIIKTFQLIATSDMWMQNFQLFLKHLNSSPIVIFNDCLLDIAVYSNIDFKRKIFQSNHTKLCLSDTLRNHYETKRILIVCKDQDEICDISQYLENLTIGNFKILENHNDDEVHNYERKFQKLTPGCYKVLICSDKSFKKLQNIRNIDWLINYGFSQNWDDFIDRFKCMLEKFTSPLQQIPETDRCRCYFIINESDEIGHAIYNNFRTMYSKRIVDKLKF